jgi:hypothetical protein
MATTETNPYACLLLPLLLAALPACSPVSLPAEAPAAVAYPATRSVEAADTFHSTPVADPYRWLERTEDPEVQAWIDTQDSLTVGYLIGTPDHERIRAACTPV